MTQKTARGRALLSALSELLPDRHLQIIAAAMIARSGNPRDAEYVSHYQATLWAALAAKLQVGELTAIGFPFGAEEPKAIHPQFFSNATADFIANSVTSHGVTYSAVHILETAEPPVVSEAPQQNKGAGGRSAAYDWPSFIREALRFANLDGFQTRRQLTAHMRTWCAAAWPEQPDERTLGRKIKELCPEDIPAE